MPYGSLVGASPSALSMAPSLSSCQSTTSSARMAGSIATNPGLNSLKAQRMALAVLALQGETCAGKQKENIIAKKPIHDFK